MATADAVLIDAIAKALGPIAAVRVAIVFGSRARETARTEAERVRTEARVARRYDDEAPRRELFRAAAKRVAEEMARRSNGRS